MSAATPRPSGTARATASTSIASIAAAARSATSSISAAGESVVPRRQRSRHASSLGALGDCSEANSFTIDPRSGHIAPLNRQSTGGDNPAHLAFGLPPDVPRHLNYGSDLPRPAGRGRWQPDAHRLSPPSREPGLNRFQQRTMCVHHIPLDRQGRFFDGAARARTSVAYRLDTRRRVLVEAARASARPGAAPPYRFPSAQGARLRHQPARFDADDLPAKPDERCARARADHSLDARRVHRPQHRRQIEVDRAGRNVYVSNRGHDSIGVFAIDPANGTLSPAGADPWQHDRFFTFNPAHASSTSPTRMAVRSSATGSAATGCRRRRASGSNSAAPPGARPRIHERMPQERQGFLFRYPCSACRRRARSDDRRAGALPIYQTTAYVFEDATRAVQPRKGGVAADQSDQCGARNAARHPGRRSRLHRGLVRAYSAQALVLSAGTHRPAPRSWRRRGSTAARCRETLNSYPKFGGRPRFRLDADEPENFKRAVGANTKAFFIESLANPGGVISDIEAIARIAEQAGVPAAAGRQHAGHVLAVQADPRRRHPDRAFDHQVFELATAPRSAVRWSLILASSTGPMVISSASAGPEPAYPWAELLRNSFPATWPTPSQPCRGTARPWSEPGPGLHVAAPMLGIETLGLRMERHCANAQKVAEYLASHPGRRLVGGHAGLPAEQYHALAEEVPAQGP